MTDDSFLSIVRHDLRTSVNHIIGYSEILMEDLKEQGYTTSLDPLTQLHSNAAYLKEQIPIVFDSENCLITAENASEIKQELQRPLYEIIGYAQELKKEVNKQQNDDIFISDFDRIISAANDTLDILDDKISYIVIDAKSQSIDTTSTLSMKETERDPEGKPAVPFSHTKDQLSGKILVVDDNEMNRDMLSRHLKRQGHSVNEAESGAEALQIIQREDYDIIILDLMMPGMNGYQVLERIKQDQKLSRIPVIMISALDEMESLIRCIEMGAEDYLPKTLDPILLKARINASLEKKRLQEKEKGYINAILESQRYLANELNEAAEYVRSLLPDPLSGKITTDWCFYPSAQLGGDCFGYHWIDDTHFAVYLLDVSGHGIGAALLSVSVMNVLSTQSLVKTDFYTPNSVMKSLNETFQMENQNNMYFTIWYGVYDTKSKELTFSSAGAPPAILIYPNSEDKDKYVHQELKVEGTVIGVNPKAEYANGSVKVPDRSSLYLFSDGTFEIEKTNNRMMNFTEFINLLLSQNAMKDLRVEKIVNQIQGIHGSDNFDDDFSLLEVDFYHS